MPNLAYLEVDFPACSGRGSRVGVLRGGRADDAFTPGERRKMGFQFVAVGEGMSAIPLDDFGIEIESRPADDSLMVTVRLPTGYTPNSRSSAWIVPRASPRQQLQAQERDGQHVFACPGVAVDESYAIVLVEEPTQFRGAR